MPDVMTKSLWDSRRSLAGFAVGTALVGAMYAGFYPQVSDGAMGQAVEGFSPRCGRRSTWRTCPLPPGI